MLSIFQILAALVALVCCAQLSFAQQQPDSMMREVILWGSPTDSIDQFEPELDSARRLASKCFDKIGHSVKDSLPQILFSSCRLLLNPTTNQLRHFYLGEMHYRIGQAFYEAGDERKLGLDLMELGIGYYDLEYEPNIQFELHRFFRKIEHCAIYSEFSAIEVFIDTESRFLSKNYPHDIELNFYKPYVTAWVKAKKEQSNFFRTIFSKFSQMDDVCTSTRSVLK